MFTGLYFDMFVSRTKNKPPPIKEAENTKKEIACDNSLPLLRVPGAPGQSGACLLSAVIGGLI